MSFTACLAPTLSVALYGIIPMPLWGVVAGIFLYDLYGARTGHGSVSSFGRDLRIIPPNKPFRLILLVIWEVHSLVSACIFSVVDWAYEDFIDIRNGYQVYFQQIL